jgi:hypothetical protein
MKKYLFIYLFFLSLFAQSQNKGNTNYAFSADINYGYNLARNHSNYAFEEKMPFSFQLSYKKANYFNQSKLNHFSYTDFGINFLYHDFKDKQLGKNYGLYIFSDFYLNHPKRKFQLVFRTMMGLAYNTNPYNKVTNPKNRLFGEHLLFPFDIAFYIKSPKWQHWRAELGLGIFHYSDGNLQAPNYGANIPSMMFGLIYDRKDKEIIAAKEKLSFDKKWQYSAFLRFGMNESDYKDSGVFPFFIPGFQVSKHLTYRNRISFGAELFLSYFLKEQISYEYHTMPELGLSEEYDFKRFGLFASHEFFYGKFGLTMGVGYYIYYPYAFESRLYNRLGVKYYFNNKWSAAYSIKVHDINRAEAIELGIMYQIN